MPLDPAAQIVLDTYAKAGFDLGSMSPEQTREFMRAAPKIEAPDIHRTEDRSIPGPGGDIPLRVFWPVEPTAGRPLPVLVYFHGGGWVLGDLESHDRTCRILANDSGVIIVSVDYRLAPEHCYPAAPDDCLAATRWVAEHAGELGGDPSRLAVGGDSAGGNLAAVTALRVRDEGGPALAFQLLVYPVVGTPWDGTASYTENAKGYFLTASSMEWFTEHYMGSREDAEQPYFSPVRAADLSGLPPALVMTAEFDPLRDEGEEYGRRLLEAGVPVTTVRYDGMIHGFFGMDNVIPASRTAQQHAAAALAEALR